MLFIFEIIGTLVNHDNKRIPLSGKERALRKGCYPYYGAQGIIDYIDDFIFDGDYILLAEDGENLRSNKQNIANLASGKFWVNNHAHIITNNELSDLKYLYYLLNTIDISGFITGSTQPKLSQNSMNSIVVSIPSIIVQKKIASILSVLDDKISTNTQINQNLEAQAQAIFKSWFVDFEPFGGMIPSEWQEITFKSFLKTRSEKSDDPSVPLFSVTDTGIHPREEKFNKKISKIGTKNKIAYETDIVFGMSREILNWGIMREPRGCVSSAYNVFMVSKEINSKYLESYIKMHSKNFQDLIGPASREGQGIDKGALLAKTILLPSKEVLSKYYEVEDSLTNMIQLNCEENKRLINLRDTLLPKLMSGEIDVSVIEI